MKIGIHASYAGNPTPTGVGHYVKNLIYNLMKIDKDNQYYLYYKGGIKKDHYLKVRATSVKFNPHFTWASYNKIDIFHEPSARYIKMGKSKNIITVHDIVVVLKEDYTSAHFKKTQAPKLIKALKNADEIISVSEFTKREIIEHFSINPEKISVITHGVDTDIFKPGKRDFDFRRIFDLPDSYILFVGNIEKRKNLFNIIKSFEKIQQKLNEIHLVLIGKNGYGGEEIRSFIKESSAFKNIIQLDYVSNNQLPKFYQNAELFLFPSLYEGFGMIVLEALACGCPVVTSNSSALPEAGDHAVIYVDPLNTEDIAEKVIQLIKNKKLTSQLIEKGLTWIKGFTWEQAAQRTLQTYWKLGV